MGLELTKLNLLSAELTKIMINAKTKDFPELTEQLLKCVDTDRLDVFDLLDIFYKFDMEDQILFIEHYFSHLFLHYDMIKELANGICHFSGVESALKSLIYEIEKALDEYIKN